MAKWYCTTLYQAEGPGFKYRIRQGLHILFHIQRVSKLKTKHALELNTDGSAFNWPPNRDIYFTPLVMTAEIGIAGCYPLWAVTPDFLYDKITITIQKLTN